jgi:hypothetical protein
MKAILKNNQGLALAVVIALSANIDETLTRREFSVE